MARLRWTLQAESDLKNIYEFISLDSKHYASIHIERIREKTKLLIRHPKIGRVVPELNNKNIRELIFGNYRIIYRLRNSEIIEILTIYHSGRLMLFNQ